MVIIKEICIVICALVCVWAQIKLPSPPKSPSSRLLLNGGLSKQINIGIPRLGSSPNLASGGSPLPEVNRPLARISPTSIRMQSNLPGQNSPTSNRAQSNAPGRNSPTSIRAPPIVPPRNVQPENFNANPPGRAPPLYLRQVKYIK